MIQSKLNKFSDPITMLFKMVSLAWQTDPFSFLTQLVIQSLHGLIPLATAWLTKVLFDLLAQNLRGHSSPILMQDLIFLLIAQVLVTVLNQLLPPVNEYLSSNLGRKLSLAIKTNVYRKMSTFVGLSYFEDPSFYNTVQVVATNAQMGPTQALGILTTLLQGIITLVSFLGLLITLSPLLTAIICIAVLPQLFVQIKLGKQRFHMTFGNSPKERRAAYYGQILSVKNFFKEVRLFNLSDYFLHKFISTTEEIYSSYRAQERRELWWQAGLSFLTSGVAAGAFVVVAVQAFSGHLSLGDVALYISTVAYVQNALSSVMLGIAQLSDNALFFGQYTHLLTLKEPLQLNTSVHPVPTLTSGITFRDVSFRYGDTCPWVLRHLNLFLPVGKYLALVGLNGAGKTTLVKLLTRLYDPVEGQILWDNTDIRNFDPQELRRCVGTVFQDFAHYELTAYDNIGIGDVARIEKREAVQQAAIKAGIHERMCTLPEGYQTYLGHWLADNSSAGELSGGEWQKIALARMFMRDTELLILDEPTAALDVQSEYELYQHFRQLMRGRTALLISHRFSTVRMADIIAVVENGQITEYGQHDALIANGGTYAKLYTMQAEHYQNA